MRISWQHGFLRFELARRLDASSGELIAFRDEHAALAYLRRNLPAWELRRVARAVAAHEPRYFAPEDDDDALWKALAGRLAAGSLSLSAQPLPRGVLPRRPEDVEPERDDTLTEKRQTWIAIQLVDMEGNPVPGVRYEIKLPDGVVLDGRLDGKGKARVDGIDPGHCVVGFPDLDAEAWDAVERAP